MAPPPRRRCLHLLGAATGWALVPELAGADPGPPSGAVGRLAAWPADRATPALQVQALDGQPRSLRDYAGAPLIVNFWASYCAPCRLEIPQFNELLARHRAQGLRVLAVNHGEMPARVLQFLQACHSMARCC